MLVSIHCLLLAKAIEARYGGEVCVILTEFNCLLTLRCDRYASTYKPPRSRDGPQAVRDMRGLAEVGGVQERV